MSLLRRKWIVEDVDSSEELAERLKIVSPGLSAAFRTKSGLLWLNLSKNPDPDSDAYQTKDFFVFKPDGTRSGRFDLIEGIQVDGLTVEALEATIERVDRDQIPHSSGKSIDLNLSDRNLATLAR